MSGWRRAARRARASAAWQCRRSPGGEPGTARNARRGRDATSRKP
ncbi:hypothetical protein PT2222_210030 [Paraburkholderia tropica]